MITETSRGAPGLIIPRSGLGNRIIFRTPGSFNFTFPTFARAAKVAILGGGGGGALAIFYVGQCYGAPGGAGAGFSQKIFSDVGGLTLSGTVAAAGLGGQQLTPATNANYFKAGGNGGTTTVSLGAATMSATGGAGGAIPSASASVAAGGAGSGGDISSLGGAGGAMPAPTQGTSQSYLCPAAGGGASGSPRGAGGAGGSPAYGNLGTPLAATTGSGGGWGGDGTAGSPISTSTAQVSTGGGTFGPGAVFNLGGKTFFLGGRGGYPSNPFAKDTSANPQQIYSPLDVPWWDLEDIAGWGGGWLSDADSARAFNRKKPYGQGGSTDGQDGGGGAAFVNGGSDSVGSSGGFGGGGAGCRLSTINPGTPSNDTRISPASGGVGAGGGGVIIASLNDGSIPELRASDGGPGTVIVWF